MENPFAVNQNLMARTPLHIAASDNNTEILEFLLNQQRQEIDLEAKDMNGETPLHMAVKNGCYEAAKLLLSRGAFIEAKANNGERPLHMAAKNGCNEAAKLLLSRGAFIEAKANNGVTPLCLAVWHSFESEDCSTVKTLLEFNADCSSVKDDAGMKSMLNDHLEEWKKDKARKACNQTKDSRLSALPVDLLENIVLRLDLKDAVKTSVLAKHFKSTWHCIYNVKISDKTLKVLKNVIEPLRKVCCFELVITRKCSREKLKVWLKWLREKMVNEINVIYKEGGEAEITSYPKIIFQIESLVHLRLESPRNFELPRKICLPNLTHLDLSLTKCKSVDAFNMLVKSCPMLQFLDLGINLAEANGELICHLKLESSSLRWIALIGPHTWKEVLVSCDTPSLKYLTLAITNIRTLPNDKIFLGLKTLNYLVSGIVQFHQLNSLLEACELLEDVSIMFTVNLDPRTDWFLNIDQKNLRSLNIRGGLHIGKDMNWSIYLRTPKLKILDIVFKTNDLNLHIKWSGSCDLVRRHVCPAPLSEELQEEKSKELQEEKSEELDTKRGT